MLPLVICLSCNTVASFTKPENTYGEYREDGFMARFLVVGLDGLDPVLVETWLPELPNLNSLMKRGIYGSLQSIVQPVTPIAWTSMISGRNPGYFGFTDFTYRSERTYTNFKLIHSRLVHVPTLYTMLPQEG